MRYGVPYKGSKNKIAEWVVKQLPSGPAFVDLFAGGCAITHRALLEGRWGRYIANDITDIPQLFVDAVNGKYADERRWISREDFYRLKDVDPYVRTCWSFGNGSESYLYGELGVEPLKRAMWEICFAETPHARAMALKGIYKVFTDMEAEIARLRAYVRDLCAEYGVECATRPDGTPDVEFLDKALRGTMTAEIRRYFRDALAASGLKQSDVDKHLGNQMSKHYFGASQWELPTAEQYAKMQEIMPALTRPWAELNQSLQRLQSLQSLQSLESLQSLQSLESLQSLQRLERLQSLQRLERLERLQITRKDYRDVEIPEGAVVYCDIPYIGTAGYNGEDFDHAAFYEWAQSRPFPVYVSEYNMPDDFTAIAEKQKACTMSASKVTQTTERIFVQSRFADFAMKPKAPFYQQTLFDIAI